MPIPSLGEIGLLSVAVSAYSVDSAHANKVVAQTITGSANLAIW